MIDGFGAGISGAAFDKSQFVPFEFKRTVRSLKGVNYIQPKKIKPSSSILELNHETPPAV